MSRRSGGGSGGKQVFVSGYTRSDGTSVSSHYRSAPSSGVSRSSSSSSASCGGSSRPSAGSGHTGAAPSSGSTSRASSASKASCSGSGSIVSVKGYFRSDGTYVQPHTRAAPGTASKSSQPSVSSAASKTSSSGNVEVAGYTRKDGRHVAPHTRSSPSKSVNEAGERVYCDNAWNRNLGRVGRPIPSRLSTKSGSKSKTRLGDNVGRITSELTADEIAEFFKKFLDSQIQDKLTTLLGDLEIGEDDDEAVELAFEQSHYKMERASVEEKWAQQGVAARTDSAKLSGMTTKIDKKDVQIEKKIGQGGFGEVFAATWRGTPVAVKELRMQNMSKHRVETFKNEVEVLVLVNHPNVVRLFGIIQEQWYLALVMEYMKRSLFTAIFIDEEDFTASQQHAIILQVVEALQHLHSKDIAHCDVKTENVLLDENLLAKLTDFGLSSIRTATESSMSSTQKGTAGARGPGRGTPRYSAPEVLRGEHLSTKDHMRCDIYSLALVVFEVYVEEEAFEKLSLMQLIRQVGNGQKRPTLPDDLNKGVCNVMKKSWDSSPAARPTSSDFKTSWQDLSPMH